MIGCTPAAAAAIANSSAPNKLPVSVIAAAGIAWRRHNSMSAGMRIAPSDNE